MLNFTVDGSPKMYAMAIGWVVGFELKAAKTVLFDHFKGVCCRHGNIRVGGEHQQKHDLKH